MTTTISRKELWPVFELGRSFGTEVDIPEELVNRNSLLMKEFEDVQKLLFEFLPPVRDIGPQTLGFFDKEF